MHGVEDSSLLHVLDLSFTAVRGLWEKFAKMKGDLMEGSHTEGQGHPHHPTPIAIGSLCLLHPILLRFLPVRHYRR